MRFNGMQRISEYTQSLSAVSRARYESKVTSTGLNTDPYAIDDSQWSTSPEAVPDLTWSDMVLYMISTPSPGGLDKQFETPRVWRPRSTEVCRHGQCENIF